MPSRKARPPPYAYAYAPAYAFLCKVESAPEAPTSRKLHRGIGIGTGRGRGRGRGDGGEGRESNPPSDLRRTSGFEDREDHRAPSFSVRLTATPSSSSTARLRQRPARGWRHWASSALPIGASGDSFLAWQDAGSAHERLHGGRTPKTNESNSASLPRGRFDISPLLGPCLAVDIWPTPASSQGRIPVREDSR